MLFFQKFQAILKKTTWYLRIQSALARCVVQSPHTNCAVPRGARYAAISSWLQCAYAIRMTDQRLHALAIGIPYLDRFVCRATH